MTFALPWMLLLLLLVPAMLGAMFAGRRRAARGARGLARDAGGRGPVLAPLLVVGAVALAVVAAAQPQWGTRASQVSRSGSDLVVVLDVSRSMDATDVAPSRLGAAKKATNDVIDRLDGARIGLVVFAGSARLRFPLTSDAEAAHQVITSLTTGPVFVTGGTSAALGLDEALKAFDFSRPSGKAVLLISDGDNLGDDPSDAATKLRVAGVDLMVAGVGTPGGGTVPVLDRNGKPVPKVGADGTQIVTHLEEPFLRAVAGAAGGRYIGSNPAAISGLVTGHLRALESAQFDEQATRLPIERYPIFAGLALALLVLGVLVERLPLPALGGKRVGALAVTALFLGACATTAYSATEAGRSALQRGEAAFAIQRFSEARDQLPNNPQADLNLAAAYHAAGRYDEAVAAARMATTASDPEMRAKAFASMGHHEFAANRLPGALADFKLALLNNPDDQASRHDYEVVLALLSGARQQQDSQQPNDSGKDSQTPADGSATPPANPQGTPGANPGQPDATATTPAGPSQPGNSGQPQSAAPSQDNQPGGQLTPQQIQQQLRQIDGEVQRLLQESANQPSPEQALEILRLLEERARIAGQRSAGGAAGGPNDY